MVDCAWKRLRPRRGQAGGREEQVPDSTQVVRPLPGSDQGDEPGQPGFLGADPHATRSGRLLDALGEARGRPAHPPAIETTCRRRAWRPFGLRRRVGAAHRLPGCMRERAASGIGSMEAGLGRRFGAAGRPRRISATRFPEFPREDECRRQVASTASVRLRHYSAIPDGGSHGEGQIDGHDATRADHDAPPSALLAAAKSSTSLLSVAAPEQAGRKYRSGASRRRSLDGRAPPRGRRQACCALHARHAQCRPRLNTPHRDHAAQASRLRSLRPVALSAEAHSSPASARYATLRSRHGESPIRAACGFLRESRNLRASARLRAWIGVGGTSEPELAELQ